MKLSVLFIITAVYGFLLGLPLLLVPDAMAGMMGQTLTPDMAMQLRYMGTAFLGLGIIAWLARNSDASKARDALSMGFFIFFALSAVTSLYAQFTPAVTATNWGYVVVQALLAVGFFVVGRANMLTSKT
jgi:FtsH-binding integral membrane protein